eukprot:1282881-Rhodomonas_salina.1
MGWGGGEREGREGERREQTQVRAVCYQPTRTDIPFSAIGLCDCYALCGTELAYAATRCVVLSQRMVLR